MNMGGGDNTIGDGDTASAATSVIRLHREAAPWRDRLRRYRVLIDREKVGLIGEDETHEFPVVPGEHRIRLRCDFYGSPEKTVSLGPGEVAELVCRPGGSALAGLFALLRPHHYIAVEGPIIR
jgi:hypothetical protein